MLSINKAIYVEYTFCYRDYVCQVSKLQHVHVIGLILLSVLETTKATRIYQIEIECFETSEIDDFFDRSLF